MLCDCFNAFTTFNLCVVLFGLFFWISFRARCRDFPRRMDVSQLHGLSCDVPSGDARVSMVQETVKKSCLIVSACNTIQTHRHSFFFNEVNLSELFSALRILSRSINTPQASILLPHFIELNRVVCRRQTITLFLYLTETVGAQIGCARIVSLTIKEESIFVFVRR